MMMADEIDPAYLDEDKNPEALGLESEADGFAQAPQAVPLPPEPEEEEEDHPMAA